MRKHETTHTGKKSYPCSYCTIAFRTTGHVRRHEKIHIRKGHEIKSEVSEMIHFCPICKEDFIGVENLRTHERKHKKTNIDNDEENKKSEQSKESEKLENSIHQTETDKLEEPNTLKMSHFCNICKKEFPGPLTLKIHQRIHQ